MHDSASGELSDLTVFKQLEAKQYVNGKDVCSGLTCVAVDGHFSFCDSKCHYLHHIEQACEGSFTIVFPPKIVEVYWNKKFVIVV